MGKIVANYVLLFHVYIYIYIYIYIYTYAHIHIHTCLNEQLKLVAH